MRRRTTLLCSVPSIHPGFLGSLWRLVGLLDRQRLALGRRVLLELVRLRNRRRCLPLLTRLARRGRTARVRLPFPLPPEAPATPEVKAKAPGKSRPDGTTLPLRVGGCLAPHWRRWQAVGAETWVVTVLRDGYLVPFLDSPPPLSRTPVSFPTYRAGSPRAQALRQEIEGILCQRSLRNCPRSGSRLLQSPLPGGECVWRLETRDRSLAPERVRPADSVQDGNSRFCTVICQRGGFSSFPGSEGCVLSDPNSSRRRGRFTSSKPCVSDCRPLPRSSPGSSQLCQLGHTLTG